MLLPTRQIILGIVVGATTATALSFFSPGVNANTLVAQLLPHTFDTTKLVKFDDKVYAMTLDNSVSTKPLGVTTVRKIGMGETSFVDITTTSTGTYSSEALFSPHVRYPGIIVKRLKPSVQYWVGVLSGWSSGGGWVALPPLPNAHSYVIIGSPNLRQGTPGPFGTCVIKSASDICL
jgi:hypothetical protein